MLKAKLAIISFGMSLVC